MRGMARMSGLGSGTAAAISSALSPASYVSPNPASSTSSILALPGEGLLTSLATGIFGLVGTGQQAAANREAAAQQQALLDQAETARLTGSVSAQIAAAQQRDFYIKLAAGAAGVALLGFAGYIAYKAISKRRGR